MFFKLNLQDITLEDYCKLTKLTEQNFESLRLSLKIDNATCCLNCKAFLSKLSLEPINCDVHNIYIRNELADNWFFQIHPKLFVASYTL